MSTDNVVSQGVMNGFKIIEVDRKEEASMIRDGCVPWRSEIIGRLVGNPVSASTLYYSIVQYYGKDSVSRMRVYNWLKALEEGGYATKKHNAKKRQDEYTVIASDYTM